MKKFLAWIKKYWYLVVLGIGLMTYLAVRIFFSKSPSSKDDDLIIRSYQDRIEEVKKDAEVEYILADAKEKEALKDIQQINEISGVEERLRRKAEWISRRRKK